MSTLTITFDPADADDRSMARAVLDLLDAHEGTSPATAEFAAPAGPPQFDDDQRDSATAEAIWQRVGSEVREMLVAASRLSEFTLAELGEAIEADRNTVWSLKLHMGRSLKQVAKGIPGARDPFVKDWRDGRNVYDVRPAAKETFLRLGE